MKRFLLFKQAIRITTFAILLTAVIISPSIAQTLTDASIPDAGSSICLASENNLNLEFVQTGDFDANTEIRAVAESANETVTLGSIMAGTGNSIPLTFPEDLPTDDYTVYAKAFRDGDNLATSNGVAVSIIGESLATMSVTLDQTSQEPNTEGTYEFCQGETAAISIAPIEGASYYWYKDGVLLSNINENASGIGIFTDETGHTGPGDYHVEIVPAGAENCPYYSDTVSIDFPDAEITTSGNTLTANEGLSYQWYMGETMLDGETGRTLTAEESGDYSVEVETLEGCMVMSETTQFIVTSTTHARTESAISVFPNPAHDNIFVEINSINKGQTTIKVLDMTGTVKMVKTMSNTGKTAINTSSLKNGIYFIHVIENGKVSVEKIVKK